MKVLIVDDEKHVRDAIRLLVDWNRLGVDTLIEAANGDAAIEIIQTEKPELILTDMLMPVRTGAELLTWISQHNPA